MMGCSSSSSFREFLGDGFLSFSFSFVSFLPSHSAKQQSRQLPEILRQALPEASHLKEENTGNKINEEPYLQTSTPRTPHRTPRTPAHEKPRGRQPSDMNNYIVHEIMMDLDTSIIQNIKQRFDIYGGSVTLKEVC
jgi:hypothetical protein